MEIFNDIIHLQFTDLSPILNRHTPFALFFRNDKDKICRRIISWGNNLCLEHNHALSYSVPWSRFIKKHKEMTVYGPYCVLRIHEKKILNVASKNKGEINKLLETVHKQIMETWEYNRGFNRTRLNLLKNGTPHGKILDNNHDVESDDASDDETQNLGNFEDKGESSNSGFLTHQHHLIADPKNVKDLGSTTAHPHIPLHLIPRSSASSRKRQAQSSASYTYVPRQLTVDITPHHSESIRHQEDTSTQTSQPIIQSSERPSLSISVRRRSRPISTITSAQKIQPRSRKRSHSKVSISSLDESCSTLTASSPSRSEIDNHLSSRSGSESTLSALSSNPYILNEDSQSPNSAIVQNWEDISCYTEAASNNGSTRSKSHDTSPMRNLLSSESEPSHETQQTCKPEIQMSISNCSQPICFLTEMLPTAHPSNLLQQSQYVNIPSIRRPLLTYEPRIYGNQHQISSNYLPQSSLQRSARPTLKAPFPKDSVSSQNLCLSQMKVPPKQQIHTPSSSFIDIQPSSSHISVSTSSRRNENQPSIGHLTTSRPSISLTSSAVLDRPITSSSTVTSSTRSSSRCSLLPLKKRKIFGESSHSSSTSAIINTPTSIEIPSTSIIPAQRTSPIRPQITMQVETATTVPITLAIRRRGRGRGTRCNRISGGNDTRRQDQHH